jgi:hypothetical protein
MRIVVIPLVASLVAASIPARADEPPPVDYFRPGNDTGAVTMRREKSRTPQQRWLIAGLVGGTALTTGLGILFHLDSRAAANRVSADTPTETRWSPADADDYERAGRSGAIAIAAYSIGALLAAAAVVVVIRTEPGTEEVDLRKPRAFVAPTPDRSGGVVGAGWSF